MKKNKPFRELFIRSLKKTLLTMRIAVILMILGILQARATDAYSQKTRLSLNFSETELVKVLDKIEAESEFFFLYNEKLLDTERKVSIDAKDQLVSVILNKLFTGTDVQYTIIDRKIILAPDFLTEVSQPQQNKVTGTVTDKNGPIPGANVVVTGTTQGTITDIADKYSIEVPQGAKSLTFSFIGMEPQVINIGTLSQIDVTMAESAIALEEVVVIGYGTTSRANLTGSAATIKAKSLTNLPGLRVDQMLQGKASGMMVTQVNGSPGASSSIRIRGINSITASSEPLYVVDGLLGGGDLSTINPSDIADISVLKDASATAIYGSRGANGVILITTKKGVVGSSNINLNVQQGWQWFPRKIDLLSGAQYAELLNESRVAASSNAVYANPETVQTTDWQQEIMQIAPLTNVNVSMSGGSKKVIFFLSGNYYNQDGIIKNTGVDRLQFRANIENKFNDKIKIGVNMNGGRISTDYNTVPMLPMYNALTTAPSMNIYNPDGTYNYIYPHPLFNGNFNSPVASQNLITSQGLNTNLTLNTYAEYSPFEWMIMKSTYGGQMIGYNRGNNYTDSKLPGQTTNQQFGTASISYGDYTNYQNENTINFRKEFNNYHFIDGVVGVTFQDGVNKGANAGSQGFISDELMWNNLAAGTPITRSVGSSYENWSMISYLARLNYKYKNRYLFTVTGREDGSSRLGPGNKWAYFPSVALGWIASEESFIKDLNVFSFLKLRASYGSVGNQAVGIYQTMSVLSSVSAIVDETKVNGWTPGQVNGTSSTTGNQDLKWEIRNQSDFAIEANFFNNRLNFIFDYYNSITNDLLLLTEIPDQTGYTQQMSNVGKVSNTGFDLTINTVNIESSRFKWTTDLTLSLNKNKVLQLGSTDADIITHVYNWGERPVGILRVGEPVGSFFGYASDGIWKEAQGASSIMPGAKAGSIRYKDMNGDGQFTQADCIILGNGSPKGYGGLTSSLSYKRFELNILFNFAWGAKIFNGNAPFLRSTDAQYNHYTEVLNRWDPITNPDSDVPGALNLDRELYPSDRWIFDASYVRLESINLTYNIPFGEQVKNYIKSATINLAGSNLFCLSPYNKWGYDPVINQTGGADLGYSNSLQGFDYGAYPKAATLTISVNINF